MVHVLGADSLPQEGIPSGTVTQHRWNDSRIYHQVTRDYWVYVPAQYDDAHPACVMFFQDGVEYVHPKGPVRVPTIFDNLIHKGEIPVTIGIFINTGSKNSGEGTRDADYLPLSDTYASFLLDEILPEVGKRYNLVDDPEGRAICGSSDGGLCAFTVAWERPDAFSKVASLGHESGGSLTDRRQHHGHHHADREFRGHQDEFNHHTKYTG